MTLAKYVGALVGGGSAKPSVEVVGMTEAHRQIKLIKMSTPKAVGNALMAAGNYLFERSQPLVPVRTGALKKSGKVNLTKHQGKQAVSVTYNTHYALRVHEDLEMFHTNGQAKYLSQPAKEYHKTLIHIVKEDLRRNHPVISKFK